MLYQLRNSIMEKVKTCSANADAYANKFYKLLSYVDYSPTPMSMPVVSKSNSNNSNSNAMVNTPDEVKDKFISLLNDIVESLSQQESNVLNKLANKILKQNNQLNFATLLKDMELTSCVLKNPIFNEYCQSGSLLKFGVDQYTINSNANTGDKKITITDKFITAYLVFQLDEERCVKSKNSSGGKAQATNVQYTLPLFRIIFPNFKISHSISIQVNKHLINQESLGFASSLIDYITWNLDVDVLNLKMDFKHPRKQKILWSDFCKTIANKISEKTWVGRSLSIDTESTATGTATANS